MNRVSRIQVIEANVKNIGIDGITYADATINYIELISKDNPARVTGIGVVTSSSAPDVWNKYIGKNRLIMCNTTEENNPGWTTVGI